MTDYSEMLPEPYPVLQKNSATYDEEKKLLSEKRIGAEMSDEMKNCPFCGWDYAEHAWNEFGEEYWVCDNCGASSGTVDSKWNWQTRPIEDALRERAERAEQMVERLIWLGNQSAYSVQTDFCTRWSEEWYELVTEWKEAQQ